MANRKSTKYLVVHVTATPEGRDIGAKEVDAMHKARGWSGIGYHYVIRIDGTVEEGRPLNRMGAHVAGWNSQTVGIAIVGGVDKKMSPKNTMTKKQEASLIKLLKKLQKTFPHATICGHRDLSPDRDRDGFIEPHEHLKACPCFDSIPWAEKNGLRGAPIKGVWTKEGDQDVLSKPVPDADEGRIVYLQKLLRRSGFEFGPIDGIIGPKTRAAIKRFQKAAGYDQSGNFDDATVNRLRQIHEEGIKPLVESVVAAKDAVATKAIKEIADRSEEAILAARTRAVAAEAELKAANEFNRKLQDDIALLKRKLHELQVAKAAAQAKRPWWRIW